MRRGEVESAAATRGREGGQIVAMLALMAVGLIALGAFVMDVGSWFRAHRAVQATADAAALAGAQKLPQSTSSASSVALANAAQNGGGVASGDVAFESSVLANDTIAVTARKQAPAFLAKVLGFDLVNVKATAKARAYLMSQAKWAAPFGIKSSEPVLSGTGCPCFGTSWDFTLGKVGPGGFEVINIDGSKGGTGPGTLASWIANGLTSYMPLGWYYSDPGAKFNSSQVQNAMDSRVGSDLLFPVYDQTQGNGSNLQYHVIGWAAVHMTGWAAKGTSATITGYLNAVTWDGLESLTAGETPDYGVHTIRLVG